MFKGNITGCGFSLRTVSRQVRQRNCSSQLNRYLREEQLCVLNICVLASPETSVRSLYPPLNSRLCAWERNMLAMNKTRQRKRLSHHHYFPSAPAFDCFFAAPSTVSSFSHLLSIHQPLTTVNHCIPHFPCAAVTRSASRETWHCPSWRPHCLTPLHTNTYTQTHTSVNATNNPWAMAASVSDRITPVCDECFSLLLLLCLPFWRFPPLSFPNHLFPKAQNGFCFCGVCG